ncbi:MAG: EamA family transporter [Verrucomicrobia bacterium]|nr:MAG: EamA family transporter [Verrucomicrobiota bacterium]
MSTTRRARWHASSQITSFRFTRILFSLSARVLILTLAAMIAFASNSLLCRAALKQTSIDAASFTFVRVFSGAVVLWLVTNLRRMIRTTRDVGVGGNWISALALFLYAAGFSFAYVDVAAGTGALLLFGAVQATMILWGLHKGERLRAIQIVGLVVAMTGLVVLLFPGLSAPPLFGSILMLGAGVAWGIYSLRGKRERNPVTATTGNFVRAVPFAAAVSIIFLRWLDLDIAGVIYAIISGAITSGLGYVIWYCVLPSLKAASAATVQLSVPVLAATGGILLLGEPITLRYVLASIAVLGGIALVVVAPHSQDQTASPTGQSRS